MRRKNISNKNATDPLVTPKSAAKEKWRHHKAKVMKLKTDPPMWSHIDSTPPPPT